MYCLYGKLTASVVLRQRSFLHQHHLRQLWSHYIDSYPRRRPIAAVETTVVNYAHCHCNCMHTKCGGCARASAEDLLWPQKYGRGQ